MPADGRPRPGHHNQAGRRDGGLTTDGERRCAPSAVGDQRGVTAAPSSARPPRRRRPSGAAPRRGRGSRPGGSASTWTTVASSSSSWTRRAARPSRRPATMSSGRSSRPAIDVGQLGRVEDRRERPDDPPGARRPGRRRSRGRWPGAATDHSMSRSSVGPSPIEPDLPAQLVVGPRPGDGHAEAARVDRSRCRARQASAGRDRARPRRCCSSPAVRRSVIAPTVWAITAARRSAARPPSVRAVEARGSMGSLGCPNRRGLSS